MGSILKLVSDGTHKTPEYKDSGVLFLSVQNVSKGYFDLSKVKYVSQETHDELCKRVKPRNRDILLCRIGTLGKPIIVDVDYEFSIFVSLGLLRLIDERLAEWVVTCIDAPIGFRWIQRVKVGGGTHTFKINLGDIPDFLIPLPPNEEQVRIREKLSIILDQVGGYEELQEAREHLDAELPDRLRKSILQLAVQGKLVDQDPADEPASALLDRVRAERATLMKAGKLKAPKGGESVIYRASDGSYYEKCGKSEAVCINDEIPFEIPESWAWARMSTVATLHSGTSYKKDEIRTSGIRVIRGGNIIVPNVVLADDDVFLDKAFADNEKTIHEGDIVIVASTGSSAALGRAAYVNEAMPGVQIGAFLRILRSQTEMRRWNWLIMSTEYYRSRIRLLAKGTNISNIKEAHIMDMLIPVPPIKEQSRIVSQVERLLASIG